MTVASRSASNSMSKDSRVLFGNHAGARCRVNATPSAPTVVITSAAELTGTALYTAASPGMLIVLQAVTLPATNQGKTANITGITTTSLTVSVDFSTILLAGDIIAVVPPLSVELFMPPQGHSLNTSLVNDYTMGLTETFNTHNTPMQVEVGGDVPLFQVSTSEAFARMLAFAIGAYKTPTSGTHTYRPLMSNDTTFANSEEATILTQDGNSVVRQVFFGLFGSKLVLNYPEGGIGTGTLTVVGAGAAREIGGAGRLFTSGANNYIRANFVCDTGPRFTFRGVFAELGGTFGAGITSAAMTTVKNLTVTIERGSPQDRTLGDPYIIKPEETTFKVTVTGTRILNDDTLFESSTGGANDAEAGTGAKTETRLLIVAVSANDATKSLTVDMPRGIFSQHSITRAGQSRFFEDFTYEALHTLVTATGCVDTALPILQTTLVNGVSKSLLTAI